jgi:uncharacterized protein (TIGR03000 family)
MRYLSMTPTKGLLFASLALLLLADTASAQGRGRRGGRGQGFDQGSYPQEMGYQQEGQPGSYRSFYPPNTALPATIELNVPGDAQVLFNGQQTTQTGTLRRFVTPPLNPESDYSYELKVRYNQDGQQKEETRTIAVVAGGLRQLNIGSEVAANQQQQTYRAYYPPNGNLPATIELTVPADAQVWFDGQATTQTGTLRRFVTPPLRANSDYSYELKVRWNQDGQQKEETRTISVVAGAVRQLNLLRSTRTMPEGRESREIP